MSDTFGVWDGRKAGWFRVDNAVVRQFGKDIGPTAFMVYSALAMHANKARASWPSYNTLANITGISRRSIITAIQKLTDCGLISLTKSDTKGNIYVLEDVDKLVQILHQQTLASANSAPTSANSAPALVQKTTRLTDANKTHITIPNKKRDFSGSENDGSGYAKAKQIRDKLKAAV